MSVAAAVAGVSAVRWPTANHRVEEGPVDIVDQFWGDRFASGQILVIGGHVAAPCLGTGYARLRL